MGDNVESMAKARGRKAAEQKIVQAVESVIDELIMSGSSDETVRAALGSVGSQLAGALAATSDSMLDHSGDSPMLLVLWWQTLLTYAAKELESSIADRTGADEDGQLRHAMALRMVLLGLQAADEKWRESAGALLLLKGAST